MSYSDVKFNGICWQGKLLYRTKYRKFYGTLGELSLGSRSTLFLAFSFRSLLYGKFEFFSAETLRDAFLSLSSFIIFFFYQINRQMWKQSEINSTICSVVLFPIGCMESVRKRLRALHCLCFGLSHTGFSPGVSRSRLRMSCHSLIWPNDAMLPWLPSDQAPRCAKQDESHGIDDVWSA